jgi:hypothetical protein
MSIKMVYTHVEKGDKHYEKAKEIFKLYFNGEKILKYNMHNPATDRLGYVYYSDNLFTCCECCECGSSNGITVTKYNVLTKNTEFYTVGIQNYSNFLLIIINNITFVNKDNYDRYGISGKYLIGYDIDDWKNSQIMYRRSNIIYDIETGKRIKDKLDSNWILIKPNCRELTQELTEVNNYISNIKRHKSDIVIKYN